MKIELKNVKYAAFASEETSCFEATVYIDGKKAGTVSNDGHGGSHSFHPWSIETKLNEYGKTLPTQQANFTDPDTGRPYELAQDAESLINDALTDHLVAKDVKRAFTKNVLFTKKTKKGIFQLKFKTKTDVDTYLARDCKLEKFEADQILNLLPFNEAVKIYRSSAN